MAASAKSLLPRHRFHIKTLSARHAVNKLPVAYQKFYEEWQETESTPVHWNPSRSVWERNKITGEV